MPPFSRLAPLLALAAPSLFAADAPPAATAPAAPAGMILIKGGTFVMGSEDGPSDEQPIHQVDIRGFYIDKTEVTNEQFADFVKATGYVTVAEKVLTQKDIPGLLPQFEGKTLSLCHRPPAGEVDLSDYRRWWAPVIGANWRHPDGEGSNLTGKEKNPVVHVCWDDAMAYGKWAGKRLPTEAEWEFAARGGQDRLPFIWGREFAPGGKHMCNTWQGKFPTLNTGEDGYKGTAPVGKFEPNGYGLSDMAGNVWEWCSDLYLPDYYKTSPRSNPPGPKTSYDPDEPGIAKHVTRGGSWMCADSYCRGYRPSARMKTSPDTGMQNLGFRCAMDVPAPKEIKSPETK